MHTTYLRFIGHDSHTGDDNWSYVLFREATVQFKNCCLVDPQERQPHKAVLQPDMREFLHKAALQKMYREQEELSSKLQFVLDNYVPCEDGVFTFPDGDAWAAKQKDRNDHAVCKACCKRPE